MAATVNKHEEVAQVSMEFESKYHLNNDDVHMETSVLHSGSF